MSGAIIFNVIADGLHFYRGDFFELLKDRRNLAVEVSYCFFWFLLEVLEVGTDNFGFSFLIVDSQELCFDDVKLGEVKDVFEVQEGVSSLINCRNLMIFLSSVSHLAILVAPSK